MNISVVKKPSVSLFDFIQNETLSNVSTSAIAQLWSNTTGFQNNYGSFSNLDTRMYLTAILSDGTEVQCHTDVFYAACISGAEHQKELNTQTGNKHLPDNWVEIKLDRYRYYDSSNRFKSPNYSDITIAKNNGDGTATVFKTQL